MHLEQNYKVADEYKSIISQHLLHYFQRQRNAVLSSSDKPDPSSWRDRNDAWNKNVKKNDTTSSISAFSQETY
jgi:hypothetical protein